MAAHRVLPLLLIACALQMAPAQATERVGDKANDDALEAHARAVGKLEREFHALIDIAPDAERFELYRTSNQLIGAWVQVDMLQTLLDRAVAVSEPDDEATARSVLREQAQFVLWELDAADRALIDAGVALHRPDHVRINIDTRTLLWQVQATVIRILSGTD